MAPHNTDHWRSVLALVEDHIATNPGNFLTIAAAWPADKMEGTCEVWGAKGSTTIRISHNTLVEITFKGRFGNMANQFVNQTSVSHHTRTGHPAIWKRRFKSRVDTQCECTIDQIQEDYPSNPVTEYEQAFRPLDPTEREDLKKLRDEVAMLQGTITDLEERLKVKEAENESLNHRNTDDKRVIEQLQASLNDSERDFSSLEETRHQLIDECKAEKAQKNKLLSELAAVRSSMKRARALLFDIDGLEVVTEGPAPKRRIKWIEEDE